MAAVTICSDFGAQENKVCHFSPPICHEVMGLDAMILVFWILSFKPAFSLSCFTFIKRVFSPSLLSINRLVLPAYLRSLIDAFELLEKTLESPLDYKEIQPVHPKGNQSWIFFGRTDAEAETPILWPPDAENWFI